MLAFFVLIAVLFAADTDGPQEASGGDGPTRSTVGEPARDGMFAFTLTGSECGLDSVGDGSTAGTPQGEYCLHDSASSAGVEVDLSR